MAAALINGISVTYDDRGDARRRDDVILLVHGHPFNRSMWRPQYDAIVDAGWRAIVPDLRGYGETTVVPGKTTLDVFARDLAALLDDLGIVTIVIGGLSMGGQIVMEFVRLFPHRVRGLLLAATFPQADTAEAKVARLAMAERLVREGMNGYASEVLPKMIAPRNIEALPRVAAQVMTMMRTTDPEGAAAALRGRVERQGYEAVLAEVAVPALVVRGSEDAFTSLAQAEGMHALLRHSQLLLMNGVGHMPNLERTPEFNAALVQFLTRVTGAAL